MRDSVKLANRGVLISVLSRAWDNHNDRGLADVLEQCWSYWKLDDRNPPSLSLREQLDACDRLKIAMVGLTVYRPMSPKHRVCVAMWQKHIDMVLSGRNRDTGVELAKSLCRRLVENGDKTLARIVYESVSRYVSSIDQEAAELRTDIYREPRSSNVYRFPQR